MSSVAPPPRFPSSSPVVPGLVVIGNFDGVHRGHLFVLRRAAEIARDESLRLKVLTFSPHPRTIVSNETVPVLTTVERKCALVKALDLNIETVVYPFTSKTAALSPEEFVVSILKERLATQVVMVGQNFRFGRGRSGDLAALERIGTKHGMVARAESLKGDSVGPYSSTRIRAYLQEGDVRGAAAVLGRPHLLSGRVVQGDQRGRTLGFPTANLAEIPEVLPQDGVYAAHVYDLSTGGKYVGQGAVNVGIRPTVGRPHAVEVHVIGQELQLYGRRLAVEIVDRVRPVVQFSDLLALKNQIQQDLQLVSSLLADAEPSSSVCGFD